MTPMFNLQLTLDEYSHVYASLHFSADKLALENPFDDRVPVLRHLADTLKADVESQIRGK